MTVSRPLSRARSPRPHRLALALAASSLLTLPPVGAQVLPSGASVVAGQAHIAVNGGNMTVTNAANTILNWNSFSIGAQNAVRFQQPNAASQVLNRVTGNDPSSILGQLSSNGKVWLLNPNGVLFGQGARIDVGGLVTSTLRLNDQDWLAGRYAFSAGAPGAAVVNQGELRSTLGGRVVLLGGSVRNEGLIDAPGGQVLLAAGDSMELVDTGAPNLTVRLTASQGEALNLGTLRSSGGRIDVHAAVVNQQGLVQADALSAGPGGEIVLQAKERLSLANGSVTSATAVAGQGGEVKLLGREVGLFGNAKVDASGASGGGQVLVGGGLQGKDSSVPNAEAVYFGREATIKADATARGDGGRIILWSDDATRAFGSLSARGGPQGGDGGFVETSGGWLDARPLAIDVGATHGTIGQWLLDPHDIIITDSPGSAEGGYDASFTATADYAQIASGTIATALNAGTNVTVSTGSGGAQAGNITMSSANIVATAANPGSLNLIADADITMAFSDIQSSGGPMSVSLLAGRGGSGKIQMSYSGIRTAGGNVLLGGYGTGLNPDDSSFGSAAASGVSIQQFSTLDAGTGRLEINARSTDGRAIEINDNGQLTGADIVLRGYGAGSDASGVRIGGSSLTATHSLVINGRSAGAGVGVEIDSGYFGTTLSVAPAQADSTAALVVTGRSDSEFSGVSVTSSDSASVGTQLRVSNSATLAIRGSNDNSFESESRDFAVALGNDSGNPNAPLLYSNATGGAISVSTFGADTGIRGHGAVATAESSTLTMAAEGSLTLSRAQLSAAGLIDLSASKIELIDGTTVHSSASGEAIWLRGSGAAGLDYFEIQGSTGEVSDPGLLLTPNGRWIVWGSDILQASNNFGYGDLAHDFKRYGVSDPSAWARDLGNGFVFSASQEFSMHVSVLDKIYDGTTVAHLSGGSASGVNGDVGSLRANATTTFSDKNAGTGKSVFYPGIDAFAMFDTDGKPVYGYSSAAIIEPLQASITPAQLAATVTANNKVYDATTRATVNVSGITGLIGNETMVVNTQAAFGDKNVGTGKTLSGVQFNLADGSNGGLASNYFFSPPDVQYRADITPLLLRVSGLVAANKVYDASTGASFRGTAGIAPLASDQLTLNGTAAGQFADQNVGMGKTVALTGLSLGGADAGNYLLQPLDLQADITPAQLLYVANTAARVVGTTLTGLSGQVIGFVGGETQASATSGTLNFSGASSATTVGTHAIDGSGLSAGNYQFTQAPGNAQALQLLAPPSDGGGASADTSVHAAVQTLQLPTPPSSPLISGLADLSSAAPQTPAVSRASAASASTPGAAAASTTASTTESTPAPAPASTSDFGSVRLGSLSLGDLQGLLDARDSYKKTVFSESISKLEQDPSLADMKACGSLGDAASGTCMITEALKAQAQAEGAATASHIPSVAAAAATPVAQSAATATAALPRPAPTLLSKRRVQTASLPQIERKVALVIGVNLYADASIPQLGNAVGDAQALGRLFDSKLGYETVVLENPSKSAVVAALNRLALELGPRDSALVYYAGHGELIESTRQGYWQLTDSDAKKPETWLSNADIARLVQQIGASQVALISDSCFSGALADGERIRATPGQADAGQLLTHKAVVAMSSGGNEPVFDAGKGGHSPFAWSLMQSLGQVSNWQPGGNVFERVRFAVARELPQRPRYGASAGHQSGGDYLFEQRQLAQSN